MYILQLKIMSYNISLVPPGLVFYLSFISKKNRLLCFCVHQQYILQSHLISPGTFNDKFQYRLHDISFFLLYFFLCYYSLYLFLLFIFLAIYVINLASLFTLKLPPSRFHSLLWLSVMSQR